MNVFEKYKSLGSKSWANFEDKVSNLIKSEAEANQAVQELLGSGWRTNVAAAKIIAYYGFQDPAKSLITSFQKAPDYYTCIACANMIIHVFKNDTEQWFNKMKKSLTESDRDLVMLKQIEIIEKQ